MKPIKISEFFWLGCFVFAVVDFLAKAASPFHIWLDVLTGLERQGYMVSLFCHLPAVGFHWPQHTPSNPCSTTNKSLSSDTIQQKVCWRSSTRTLSVFAPYLFRFSPFQRGRCLTWQNWCVIRSKPMLFAAIMVRTEEWNSSEFGSSFYSFTDCCRSPPGKVSTITHTTRSLFPETFCHVTLGTKWHFNILSSDHVWGAIMAWCMFLWEHVSFSKSHPLIFDSFLSMQTVPLSPTHPGKL